MIPLYSHTIQDWDSRTPLLHAILGNHEQTATSLLDSARLAGCARQLANAYESETDGAKASGLAPLHAACDKGMHTVVKALCVTGADIEMRDAAGGTPLLHACKVVRIALLQTMTSSQGHHNQPSISGPNIEYFTHSKTLRPVLGIFRVLGAENSQQAALSGFVTKETHWKRGAFAQTEKLVPCEKIDTLVREFGTTLETHPQ